MNPLAFALAFAAASTHTDPPFVVRPPDHAPIMSGVTAPTLNPAEGEIIYDSLCIMDNPWEAGNGDACGGRNIFGNDYDLQAADDFTLDRAAALTGIAMDYLTFFGECPETLCISVFAGECGDAEDYPYVYVERPPDACIDLVDPYGDYAAKRFVVKGYICELPAGRWYISMNPKFGDFAFVVMDIDPLERCGDDKCDVLLRDGSSWNPCCRDTSGCFCDTRWFPSANYWGAPSAMSMQIQVTEGLAPSRCLYLVKSVRVLSDPCEHSCDTCPYVQGDLICKQECPGGVTQCSSRLVGYEACANGTVCQVRTKHAGCVAPRRKCDQCPMYGACCVPGRHSWLCQEMSEAQCRERHGVFHADANCSDVDCD